MNAKKPAKPAAKKKPGKLTVKEESIGVKAGAATAVAANGAALGARANRVVAGRDTISQTRDIESCRSCSQHPGCNGK